MNDAPTDKSAPPTTTSSQERDPPRKRRRLVVSCTECHRRKQKCDRDLPCANCKARNKESHCAYEVTAKAGGDEKGQTLKYASPPDALPSHASEKVKVNGDTRSDGTLSSVAAALGYSQAGASTMGFLRQIENQVGPGDEGTADGGAQHGGMLHTSTRDAKAVREKFKGLIRQLPAKAYVDKLIEMFMDKFNYQYYSVDPDIFYQQLEQWNSLPFKLLTTKGPMGLTPDMRAFPAVLFQIIGTALLVVPEEGEEAAEFEGLKYAANMTFEDLAMDYSESGLAIIALFDKRSMTITTIQAEFLRAAFLKFTAQVTDSWHAISIAIKDAQELGMHRDSLDPKPVDSSAEAALENEWLIQRRRKMYMILALWDVSMSVFLGRPGTINRSYPLPTPPVDTAAPKDRSRTPVVPRDPWKDPPTPLTAGLWNRQIGTVLFEIQDLEQEGPHPKDFSRVDGAHRRILEMEEQKPAMFRVDNPDTRWDDEPGTYWVKWLRYYFASMHGFNRMVLHRPYVFHRKKSRDEALKAALIVLEMTGLMFEGLPQDHWRNYNLFFGSFDALVMLSTIWILYPREYPDLKQSALDQFHWTMQRFSAMQARNPLAKSAQGVLKVILAKFTKAMTLTGDSAPSVPSSTTPSSLRGSTENTSPTNSSAHTSSDYSYSLNGVNGVGHGMGGAQPFATTTAPPPMTVGSAGDWTMPSMDSLASLAPMYPMYDLIFNDLDIANNGMLPMGDIPDMTSDQDTPWHFGGGFGQDTVWQLLNQYDPSSQAGPQ